MSTRIGQLSISGMVPALRGGTIRWLCLAWLAWLGCLAGCKSTAEPCQREMSACLKRCDASGLEQHPAVVQATPQNTVTPCEARCQSCRNAQQPAPAGRPTPTGTAPVQ